MPYIITTTIRSEARDGDVIRGQLAANRTAVATLDEARERAHETVHAAYRAAYPLKPQGLGGEHSDAQRAHRWHNVNVEKLPETGGTVGPLPDGTVIEVRRLGAQELIQCARQIAPDDDRLVEAGAYEDTLASIPVAIATFNAA